MGIRTWGAKAVATYGLFLVSVVACADGSGLPPGWKVPDDLLGSNDWRKDNKDRYLATEGDFNGDGKTDRALLLAPISGVGFGVFVYLSQGNGTLRLIELAKIDGGPISGQFGISTVGPGKYKTACGKGYWDCAADEVPELTISNDAIDLFKREGANSFFVWDDKAKSFRRTWISD